jgi:ribosomal protein S12 methylthiotransferase accessory factor
MAYCLNKKAAGSPWEFGPSPKIMAPVSRVTPPEETERRVVPLLARLPVTRIADLTPLDEIRLPVFTAVTPLAKDLTTHMGKGADATSARVSALMEAVERISAETAPTAMTIHSSFAELIRTSEHRPLDPEAFTLPDDTRYTPERTFTWIASQDLLSGEAVLMPADLVLNPPSEGILQDVDTNGLASGNTYLEAVVHGLGEVIERDVDSQLAFMSLFCDPHDPQPSFAAVDPASLPLLAAGWIERLRSHGLDVVIHEVTNDIGVASLLTLVSDYKYPTPSGLVTQHFAGWGTAPDAELALLRSLTEAVQSRLGIIQAARDSFNTTRLGMRMATRGYRRRLLQEGCRISLSEVPSFRCADLREDLRFLFERLIAVGVEQIIVTDLSRLDLGIPVVRVRVPGLATFSVNQRRVGWRCLRHLL